MNPRQPRKTSSGAPSPHVNARTLLPVLRVLKSKRVDPRPALAAAGVTAAEVAGFDRRIEAAAAKAAWDKAAVLCEEPALGIRAAMLVEPGDFDVLEFAMESAATFGDAVRILDRYHRLLHNGAVLCLTPRGEVVDCEIRSIRDAPLSDHFAEATLASWTIVTRRLLDTTACWSEVRFVHARPKDTSLHEAFFRAPVRFGCPYDGITAPAPWLTRPVATAAPALHKVLDRHATALLDQLPTADLFVHEVRSRLASQVGDPNLDCPSMAKHFGMSERSFRRRLERAGVRYSELRDKARQQCAMQLVLAGRHSSEEVAFMVGYDDMGGFQRAVRRWTGLSFGQWRAELVGPS